LTLCHPSVLHAAVQCKIDQLEGAEEDEENFSVRLDNFLLPGWTETAPEEESGPRIQRKVASKSKES
jgi:hypothetical protein